MALSDELMVKGAGASKIIDRKLISVILYLWGVSFGRIGRGGNVNIGWFSRCRGRRRCLKVRNRKFSRLKRRL